MGRPWWYDSYWQKGKPPGRRPPRLSQRAWVWIALVVLAIWLSAGRAGFRLSVIGLLVGFVSNACRILSLAILVRVVLSWFGASPYSRVVALLDDLTEPVLYPIRRAIPPLGMLDLSPLVAILLLNFIPSVFARLLGLLVF